MIMNLEKKKNPPNLFNDSALNTGLCMSLFDGD